MSTVKTRSAIFATLLAVVMAFALTIAVAPAQKAFAADPISVTSLAKDQNYIKDTVFKNDTNGDMFYAIEHKTDGFDYISFDWDKTALTGKGTVVEMKKGATYTCLYRTFIATELPPATPADASKLTAGDKLNAKDSLVNDTTDPCYIIATPVKAGQVLTFEKNAPTGDAISYTTLKPGETYTCKVNTTINLGLNDTPGAVKAMVFRLYNKATSEHLWTTDINEYIVLAASHGWIQEDISWTCPASGLPVYRLYNPSLGDHHYTADANEINVLTTKYGWQYDKGGQAMFQSAQWPDTAPMKDSKPVYRLYNKDFKIGQHMLTMDENEYKVLPKYGWKQENVAFYAL